MPVEISMPQLSDTMTEGTLVKWLKHEGDKVRAGEEIAEVETDKATMPMEAFEAGTIAYLAAKEGDKVEVGKLLAVIAAEGEDAGEVKSRFAGGKGQEVGAKPQGSVAKPQAAAAPQGEAKAVVTAAPEPVVARAAEGVRVRVSPLARKMAAARGIALEQVRGSGPGGRIVERDLAGINGGAGRAAASLGAVPPTVAKPVGPPLAPPVDAGQTRLREMSKIRLTIAKRLQLAKQNIPHFYETMDIDVEELTTLRSHLNEKLKAEGVKLSLGDLIARGLAAALKWHPALNATFDGQSITEHGDVNLGMAVALDNGLIVPVLRGIDRMGIREIRQRSADLVERARAQRLRQEEMTGATFTVSNLGAFGVREFSAIINPPEVAILAIGAAAKRAVADAKGGISARTVMSVTLSADHRAVDGAVAAQFLQTLKSILEEPGMMLL